MHCPNCGKELKENQKFCGGCGSDVSGLWQTQAAPVTPAPEPVPEPVVAAPMPEPVPEPVVAAPIPEPVPEPAEAAPAPVVASGMPMPMPFAAALASAPAAGPAPVPVEAEPVQTPEPEPVAAALVAPAPEPVPAAPAPAPVEAAPVMAAPAPAPVEAAPVMAAPAPAPAPAPFGEAPVTAAPAPIDNGFNAPVAPAPATVAAGGNEPPKKKKGKVGLIIGLCAGGLALVIAAVIGIAIFINNSDVGTKPTKKTVATETDETDPTTDPAPAKAKRTVMVYAIGTDLESKGSNLSADVKEMLAAQPGKSVNVVLQTGGCKDFQNNYMQDGACQRFAIQNGNIKELANLGDVSMVEPGTLQDFIKFAKENYPAENYILVMWDHGGGVPLGFGQDELHEGTLTEIEFASAIANADIKFESVIFNACLMGSLEVAKALDPYTDYIVAAESPTWGSAYYDVGINYTNFLNYIGDNFTGTVKDYSEFIVRDYMDTIEKAQVDSGYYGIDTCMSAIDTKNINEVLNAYEKFIAALDKRVFATSGNNGFAEYVQLREACGAFQSTDSVDLTTLASKYINCGDKEIEQAASKLINEVSNSVFTESNNNYTYAHGMTTYAPYLYPDKYTEARVTFTTLGYHDSTILFYDKFVSKELFILKKTNLAGDWYIQPSDAGQIDSGKKYDLASLVVNMGNYEAIKLTPDNWKTIREVKVTLAYMQPNDKSKIYYMGTDNQYTVDKNGYIILQNPTKWVYFNGFGFVTCQCLKYEVTDDGKWTKYIGAEALVNDKTAYVVIASSSAKPEGEIIGYYYADILNDKLESNQGNQFKDDDKLVFVQEVYDSSTKTMDYKPLGKGKVVTYKEALSLYKYSNVDYTNVNGYIGFNLYDVYNNEYQLALRPGKPANEINAGRGDNNGSSSGSDYDKGTTDVSSMVNVLLIHKSDSVLNGKECDWISSNKKMKKDGIYLTTTKEIDMCFVLDSDPGDEFTYAVYYSEDKMFSQKELSGSVYNGKTKAVKEGDKYKYHFKYNKIKAGYYIVVVYDADNNKVATSACQVVKK